MERRPTQGARSAPMWFKAEARKTPVMELWEREALGGADLREYLVEAVVSRGLGRDAIARDLEARAKARRRKLKVCGSTVGIALYRLGVRVERVLAEA